MSGLLRLVFGLIVDLFRSRAALEAEIILVRQQIIVLRQRKATRLPFTGADRLVLGWVCRLFPKACDALAIVRPETVVRWHRAGFRSYWRWKSRRRAERPAVSTEIRLDPRDEHCQSVVGSAADSRRAAQARHRRWADQRRQVYGTEEATSFTGMEDVSSQSCRRHRGDGPVRGANRLVPVVIWPLDHGAWPETDPVAWRYRASNRRVDRQPTHTGIRLGPTAELPDPRPGCLLRQRVHPPPFISWPSRSPDIVTLTLAKWVCGASDRLSPPR